MKISKEDKEIIIKLRRVTKPIQSELDEIMALYRKYIDPNAQDYCSTCNGNGYNSITNYYWKVVQLNIE